ncbi:MAG TPA: DUF6622 family protein [Polaromonas sp.]|uniref:DUF6622 family protein n=1 Tax=Polaromonas sp. TaxID=1869339 RepID=UPI002D53A3C4|nr:DUF6622 family protein [Polaromonas sp.]HYW56523.1 DUF6622 family protein [Polaromonas sp.]
MELSPLIAVHITAALGAVVTGPVVLWARRETGPKPKLHRAFGYAWVTLMLITAITAIFIRDFQIPNISGITPIHALIPVVFGLLILAFWFLSKGNIKGHRMTMLSLYIGACIVAGAFTLIPGRYMGNLVFGQWLGLISPNHQSSAEGTPLLIQILIDTPLWVWGLLAALLVLGISQTRNRSVGLARIVVLPLGMGAFSLYGTISAFDASPTVLGGWAAGLVLLLLVVTQMPRPAGASYNSATRQVHLPGSKVPMALIMGVFLTKYTVGASLMLDPDINANATFALTISTIYGVFTGIFAGRAIHLMRLALRPRDVTPSAHSSHLSAINA